MNVWFLSKVSAVPGRADREMIIAARRASLDYEDFERLCERHEIPFGLPYSCEVGHPPLARQLKQVRGQSHAPRKPALRNPVVM